MDDAPNSRWDPRSYVVLAWLPRYSLQAEAESDTSNLRHVKDTKRLRSYFDDPSSSAKGVWVA
jgi:hypothetical protein